MSKVSDSIQRGLEEAVAYATGEADKSLFRIHTNSGNPEREDTQSLRDTRNTRRRLAKSRSRLPRNRPQVRTRPDEAVHFRKDDPGSLGIEPQAGLGRGREFDRVIRIVWR